MLRFQRSGRKPDLLEFFFTSRHCLTQVVTAPISNGKTRTTQADASVKTPRIVA